MLFLKLREKRYLRRQAKIAKEEQLWEIEKENLQKRKKIREEYEELTKIAPNKLSMSKKALVFLFLNCTFVEIFTCWTTLRNIDLAFAMGITPDFTPLIALIGAVVGEVIGLAAYYAKSTKENTLGGIVYDSAAIRHFGYENFDDTAVG